MSGRDITYSCIVCNNVVTDGSQGLECPVCCRWQHRWHPETGVSRSEYYAAGRGDRVPAVENWKCKTCLESDTSKICIVCNKIVTDGSQGLECPVCSRWQHRWHPETGVSRSEYYAAGRGDSIPAVDTWKCKTCFESNHNEGETSNANEAKKSNGSLESNQIEDKTPKICIVCNKVVTDGSQGLECPVCYRWQHRWHPETGVSRCEYYAAGRGDSVPAVDTWKCKTCLGSNHSEGETSMINKAHKSNGSLESDQNKGVTSKIDEAKKSSVSLECTKNKGETSNEAKKSNGSLESTQNKGETSKINVANESNGVVKSTLNKGEISKINVAKKSNGQFHNTRSLENHKEEAFDTNSITNNGNINSLNQLIPEETIYQKMKNYLNGTADAKIVNTGLSNWILDPGRSAEEILQLVSKEFQNIPGASTKRDQRAWLVFMVIHNINRIPGLVIEGAWLDVIFCLISYTYDFDFQSAISTFTKSQDTRNQTMQTYSSCFNWVIQVLSSSSLCISPYLQLELIRHIYNKKCFTSLQIQGIMQGVINIMSDIDPEHLFTVLGQNFHCTPEHILFALHFPGIKENEIDRQRNILGNKIQRDLKTSRYTKEIAFVDNTIKYAGLYAQVTAQKYSNDTGNLIKYIHQCLSLFMFGSFNPSEFGKLYQSSAYKNPLLLPSTYDGIADITEAIIGVPMTFMSNKDMIDDYEEHKYMKTKYSYKRQFNKLLKRRNNLIRALDLPCTTSVLPRMFAFREINGGSKNFNRKFQKEIYKQKYMEYKI